MNNMINIIEALIFSSEVPLSEEKIKNIMGEDFNFEINEIVDKINRDYESTKRPFLIKKIQGGYTFITKQQFSPYLKRLFQDRAKKKISRSALECLSIIAVKQPITRVEVDQIRGVNSAGAINTLLEKNLITITGKKKVPGNPLLYGTTDFLLISLGLNSLEDLPNFHKVKEIIKNEESKKTELIKDEI